MNSPGYLAERRRRVDAVGSVGAFHAAFSPAHRLMALTLPDGNAST